MNKKIALLIAVMLFLTTACRMGTATPTTPPQPLHYEDDLVAFDYPGDWWLYTAGESGFNTHPLALGGDLVAGIAYPKKIGTSELLTSTMSIFRHPLPPGATLESVMRETYRLVVRSEGVLDASGAVTLAGLPALQETYRVCSGEPCYEMRDIWLEKEGQVLRVSIWTAWGNPEYFDAFLAMSDAFLASLVIK
jgi:hypothetical protein